eukprot:gene10380-15984_t
MSGNFSVKVKFGKEKCAVEVPRTASVAELKDKIEAAGLKECRRRKLVYSGKALVPSMDGLSLEQVGLKDGAVLMLTGTEAEVAPPVVAPNGVSHSDPPATPEKAPVAGSAQAQRPEHEQQPAVKRAHDTVAPAENGDGGTADGPREREPAAEPSEAREVDETPEQREERELQAALQLSTEGHTEDAAQAGSTPPAKKQKTPTDGEAEADDKMEAHTSALMDRYDSIEFERFDSANVVVDEKTIDDINKYQAQVGEAYVDPQFPPLPQSIYHNKQEAECWKCGKCHEQNRYPPFKDPPTTQEEAEALQAELDGIRCTSCHGLPSHVQKVNIVNRPAVWLRPGVSCDGCEMLAAAQGVRDVLSFVSRQCTHYLRDDLTNNTIGAPWKVIREAARPEDVYQGALGNCWFGGALSCVAAHPELIDRLFVTKEYNPIGVYCVRLHQGGHWRDIVLDDLLPCTKPFEGHTDQTTGTIYFSRGGTLCFAAASRRQLWVPLIEKASAKLFGCYSALAGGSTGEALQLLTGCPSETIRIHVSEEAKVYSKQRRDAILEQRTRLMLEGKDPDEEMGALSDDDDDDELLWSKLLSASEAGSIMGLASAHEACGRTRDFFVETLGLQTPHVYGVLQVRELFHDGKRHRLIQCRNPWGERAPRTWQGDWGRSWKGWTRELKLELGVINRSGVKMYDDMSIFWISFEDAQKYIASIEFCRTHPLWWKRDAASGWLPSELGAGSCYDIKAYTRTLANVVCWQEKHSTRESSLQAVSSNVDIGFAIVRRTEDDNTWQCLEYAQRAARDQVSVELTLEAGYTYRVVPWSVDLMQAANQQKQLRKVTVVVHTNRPIELKSAVQTWSEAASCLTTAIAKVGKKRKVGNVNAFILQEPAGMAVVAENPTDEIGVIQIDAVAPNCTSSRSDNMMSAVVAVPPYHRQLLLALSMGREAKYGFDFKHHPPESASFAEPCFDLHQPIPFSTSALLPPDQELLQHANDNAHLFADPQETAGVATETDAGDEELSEEEQLARALLLSTGEDAPEQEVLTEEEELARALLLSTGADVTQAKEGKQ